MIARIDDQSGNGTPLTQASSSLRPTAHETAQPVMGAKFDLVDDVLTTGPIAAGLTGQSFVAGDGGCYATPLGIPAGGAFTIGGTANNWTGAVSGALRAATGGSGRLLGAIIREGTFSESDIARLERHFIALGGKGLLVPGPELIVNGDFGSGLDNWGLNAAATGAVSVVSGIAEFTTPHGDFASLSASGLALTVGAPYLISIDILGRPSASAIAYCYLGGQTVFGVNCAGLASQTISKVIVPLNTGTLSMQVRTDGEIGFDNISVRRLIPQEEL